MSQNSSTNTISAANKTKQKVSMTWRCHDKRVMHVMPKGFFQKISSLFISSYLLNRSFESGGSLTSVRYNQWTRLEFNVLVHGYAERKNERGRNKKRKDANRKTQQIKTLYQNENGKMEIKTKNDETLGYLKGLFKPFSSDHGNTENKLAVPKPSIDFLQRSFCYSETNRGKSLHTN